jgi:hypothetical protein
VSPINSRTISKDVANNVSKFGGILFNPIQLTAVACYASGPLKVRLSFWSQNVPPPPSKPLHIHWYILRHLVTAHFSQLTNTFLTLNCIDYRLLWSSLWVEISTLTYVANYSCWPERLSVDYCTHIIQTKLMFKSQRYPKNLKFTGTEGPTDMPLVGLG